MATAQTKQRPLAVITGASSGIGLELAKQFAQAGYDLFLTAHSAQLEEAAGQLKTEGSVQTFRADLSQREQVERLAEAIDKLGRPVEAAALNAGFGVYGDFARETPLEAELSLLQVNVVSVVHLAKRLVVPMAARGSGRILFTSSVASTMPGPLYACYAASKAFVQSFSQALREELKDTGVTITALLPGPTETRFFERAGMEETQVGQAKKDDPAEVAREGFEALMAGKGSVVAGSFSNALMGVAGRVLPDTVKAKMHRQQLEPKH